ncbi:LysR family transcriptional regulator [Rhizobium leguminosarum]|uniref:LysR family transcriptional regulator n=1 Tax=Rhizobium TaxID=379 RepID=UPI001C910B87|nr:LysR family transcriptional regulator [Rhizobium leguminosarum]MBY2936354.1 LysR family transcriptional regulator [Rhizobium leguminosarum]MBY2938117.1 LysR family transcriptional regulator [Rhizobium leguminosarum]
MLNQIDLSRIDLNLLVLFETVMEERHVGRSGQRLNLSPSAISHGLSRLRMLLGDPLFLKTPKGVVPTDRAEELAAPIADILARVRSVVATAEPFDPAHSQRRFTIGAPDGVSSVFLPPLLDLLAKSAPGIAISIRQLLPRQGEPSPDLAWRDALAAVEARDMDIAIIPQAEFPVRFASLLLYEEDFVIAARQGHPFLIDQTLATYCAMRHLVVSHLGDTHGFVDNVLASHGCSRRVALTVPNFMFALAVLAETDFISALPRRFVEIHAARFGVVSVNPPLPLGRFAINATAPKAAIRDEGVAWLVRLLQASMDNAIDKTRAHSGSRPARRKAGT